MDEDVQNCWQPWLNIKTIRKHHVSDRLVSDTSCYIQRSGWMEDGFSRFKAVYEWPSKREIKNQNARTDETSVRNATQQLHAKSVRWEANKRAARFIAQPQTRLIVTFPKRPCREDTLFHFKCHNIFTWQGSCMKIIIGKTVHASRRAAGFSNS